VWLATENGLVRYDGNQFKIFNIENVAGMTTNRMAVFRGNASKDKIYLLNDLSEYILIKNNEVSIIPKNKIPKQFKISTNLYKNRRFYNNKIYRTDNTYYSISSKHIDLYDDQNQSLWQIKYDFNESQNFFILDNILYNYDGEKIIKFENGRVDAVRIDGLTPNNFSIITNNVSQQTFFIVRGNFYMLEKKSGKFRLKLLLENYDLSKSNIVSAYYDTEDDIFYIGSSTNGLLVVKKKLFKTISGSKKDGVYYAQIAYGSNKFLTTSGEVFSSDGSSEELLFQSHNDNYSLMLDKYGNIWTKANNIVYCFHKKSNFVTYNKWVFQDRVTQIFEMKEGKILVAMSVGGSPNGRIYTLEGTADQLRFEFYMNVHFNVTYMVQKENNIIWTGSHLGFHKIYFKEKKIENIPRIQKTYVRSIYIDDSHNIWITSYDTGFYLYNSTTSKTTHFPVDKNKYLLASHCIIEDSNGFFWITSNKGLFQVSKKELLDYANKKTKSVYYHYYDKADGFGTNEFNGGCQPCGVLLENNNVTFPSMKGIIVFDSKKIKRLLPKGNVFFEQAEVNNKYSPIINDTLFLKHDFERLRLFINSPYYGNSNNLNIETKVQGPINQKWEQLIDNNISFTTLPPGTYYLSARKMTGHNSEYQYKTLTVIISPAFYQTIWFHILLILLIIIGLYYLVKMRLKYIRLKNILLEKKIAEQTSQLRNTISTLKDTTENLSKQIVDHKKLIGIITHDIKSPLRFLAMTAKHVYQNPNDPHAVSDGIKSMHTSSSQLYNFVRNILEYTKVSRQDNLSSSYCLHTLVEEKITIFSNIAFSKKIIIYNLINVNHIVNNNRLLFSIIIHNLLDNAIKNTASGKIILSSGINENKVFFEIEDSGNGMSAELVHLYNNKKIQITTEKDEKAGMGLQIITELLEIMKGKMKIESSVGYGTKITIIFSNQKSN
jgi:signal transduction histidine kinase